jgi:glycosyltransferase involved in cell wall biosynthesis
MWASILIPTYKRAHLLGYVLEGLRKQTFRDFDVVVVLKPTGDGSEEVVEKYGKWLCVDLVLQRRGYVVDALNLGLERVKGDVIAFLDDDAIPSVDWVERHVKSYEEYENVGGVAGNVKPARLCDGKPVKVGDCLSHVIPSFRSLTFLESFFRNVWNVPLEGMEDYLVYISKAGVVEYNLNVSRFAWNKPVKSLLGMGANMSVLREAVNGFRFPSQWVLGLAWEQFLGWHLWKKGYDLIFNPKASVYHIEHSETLTRNVRSNKKNLLRCVEHYLLFYRLYGLEPKLSRMHRIVLALFSSLVNLKKLCMDKELQQVVWLKGRLYSELIGQKWLLSRMVGGYFTPLPDLEKFLD